MGLNISGIVDKAKAVITGKKPLSQDEERRLIEEERSDISAARRQRPLNRQQSVPQAVAQPARRGNAFMDDLMGFGNPPGTGVVENGTGKPARNSFMDDLGRVGTGGSGRGLDLGMGGGGRDGNALHELCGLGNERQPRKHNKKGKGR